MNNIKSFVNNRWLNIIEGIVMAIIATIMCIIFARTKATGDNNLFCILVVAAINVVVIAITIYGFEDLFGCKGTSIQQLALSIPYVVLLMTQAILISRGTIPETCSHFWWEFSIGVAICIFNIAICSIHKDIGGLACLMAALSITVCILIIIYFLWRFYTFISSI